jgi:hypothetical protein
VAFERQTFEEAADHIVKGTFPSRPAYELAAVIQPFAAKLSEMTNGEWLVRVGVCIDEHSGLRAEVVNLRATEKALHDAVMCLRPGRSTPTAIGDDAPAAFVELRGGSRAALFIPRRLQPGEARALVALVESTVTAWTDDDDPTPEPRQ